MTKKLVLKNGICLLLLCIFSSVLLATPSFAEDDVTAAYTECQDAANNRFGKCEKLLDKALAAGDEKIFKESRKCMEDNDEVLDQCRESRKLTFVKNEAWRKNNEKALSGLSDALETADDKCIQAAKNGRDKCDKIKSNKKREKCPDSVEKKKNGCMQKALKSFLAGYKKLKPPTEALEGGGLAAVKKCHDTLRSDRKSCMGKTAEKCTNKAYKGFQTCVKRDAQKAQYKKGSSYKTLAASIQKVVDASGVTIRNCKRKAQEFEKDERDKAVKAGKDLKAENPKIGKAAAVVVKDCYDTANRQASKALEAQIKQHFED